MTNILLLALALFIRPLTFDLSPRKLNTYYILISNNSRFDNSVNKLISEVYYCAIIPKNPKASYENLIELLSKKGLKGLHKGYLSRRIVFPIHDYRQNNIFKIDSAFYQKGDYGIDYQLLAKKASMLDSRLFSGIVNFIDCGKTQGNQIHLIECKGELKYLNHKFSLLHLNYNSQVLTRIADDKSGVQVFKHSQHDSSGNLIKEERIETSCEIIFLPSKLSGKSLLDTRAQYVRDTVLNLNKKPVAETNKSTRR